MFAKSGESRKIDQFHFFKRRSNTKKYVFGDFSAERIHELGLGSSPTTPSPADNNVRRELVASARSYTIFALLLLLKKRIILISRALTTNQCRGLLMTDLERE